MIKPNKILLCSFLLLLVIHASLFSSYKNPKVISEKKSHIQSSEWLNPALDYLRLNTDTDAPAKIPVSVIIKFLPKWNGQSSKYLHLLHNNLEKRIYIKDFDGIIDNKDTLYFLGSRALGDTTYWDNYATEEPFFLVYDNSYEGLRYKLTDNSLPAENIINYIEVNSNIEKDAIRSFGKGLYDTYNSDNEGWYWKEILPEENQPSINTFNTFLDIEAFSNDSIYCSLLFKSVSDTLKYGTGSNIYPEYRLTCYFNNDSLDSKEFTRIRKDSFALSFAPEKIFNGINTISVKTTLVHPKRPGTTSIDNINLRLKSKPVTNEFLTSFSLPKQEKNSTLLIEGFDTSEIIAIDSINSTIQFPEVQKKKVKINVSLKQNAPFCGVFLKDTAYYDFRKGMHLIKISSNKARSIDNLFQTYYEKSFFEFIENADSNDIFILAYNDSVLFQKEYLYALYKFPFEKVKNMKVGQSWIYIFSKKKNYYEVVSYENSSQISLEIDNDINNNFAAKLIVVPENNYSFFVRDESKFSEVNISPVSKPSLMNIENKTNVIVIYHPVFQNLAIEYVDFRLDNRELSFKAIDVNDIYNEFNFGKKSPFAIKEFLKYAKNYWSDSLSTVVFIGNASWDPYKRYSFSVATDYLPTFGYPPSDFWYSLLDDDYIPDISIGRISIDNIEDGKYYLDKLKEYEKEPDQPWMKNFLFLSGGEGAGQRRNFANMKSYFFDDILTTEPFCAITDSVAKYDESVGGVTESGVIREKINNGALWINFVGHANQNVFDMDGWQTYKLNNKGKYAFFSAISCNTGAFADPGLINVRNEDYLYFKEKGFIGSIGSSYYGWVDENRFVLMKMFEQLADPNSKFEFIGDLLNYGKNNLVSEGPQLETKHHSALIGDPLLKLRISKKSNLYLYAPDTRITNSDGNPMVNVTDSLAILHISIFNNGFKSKPGIKLNIIDFYQNSPDTLVLDLPEICFNYTREIMLNISKKPGEHRILFTFDPDNIYPELKKENKTFQMSFYVYSNSLLALDPLPNWDVNLDHPEFRVINPSPKDSLKYIFEILSEEGEIIYKNKESEIEIFENYIDWKPNFKLDSSHYIFVAYYSNLDGLVSNKLQIPFYLHKKSINDEVSILQNSDNSFQINTLDKLIYDKTLNSLNIVNKYKKIKIVSAGGNQEIKRWGNIEVDNDVYVDSEYFRGFNIVTLPINADSSKGHYKRFDTWIDGDDWSKDSTASNLVTYLRDSIPDNVYVLIATSGASWKLPALHKLFSTGSVGTLDSLQAVLRNFGSKLIDSVQGPMRYDSIAWMPWFHSFAMVGRKGWKPGEAIERMSPIGDSAYIEQNFEFLNYSGNFQSIPIGPLKKFKKIIIKSNANIDSLQGYKIKFTISGKNSNISTLLDSGQLEYINHEILLNTSITSKYQEFILNLKLEKYKEFSMPSIESIQYDFIPAPELALIRNQCALDDIERLRGEKTILHLSFENISKRAAANNFDILIRNSTSSSISDIAKYDVDLTEKGNIFQRDFTIQNEILSNNNLLEIILNDNDKEIENYKFNNKISFPFTVKDDITKPKINVTFDGRSVENGDFVAKNPLISITVSDNSPLLFNDSSKIEIYINGKFLEPDSVNYYYYQTINNLTDLKCKLFIIPKDLEYGNSKVSPSNNIRIIAKDFYGNSDTVLFKLNVLRNNLLEEINMYPNPANSEISFKFNFFGRNRSEHTLLSIYNLNGQLIQTQTYNTIIGENVHKIILKDSLGNSLPEGVYFYELKIQSELWTDPRRGIFIIQKN